MWQKEKKKKEKIKHKNKPFFSEKNQNNYEKKFSDRAAMPCTGRFFPAEQLLCYTYFGLGSQF